MTIEYWFDKLDGWEKTQTLTKSDVWKLLRLAPIAGRGFNIPAGYVYEPKQWDSLALRPLIDEARQNLADEVIIKQKVLRDIGDEEDEKLAAGYLNKSRVWSRYKLQMPGYEWYFTLARTAEMKDGALYIHGMMEPMLIIGQGQFMKLFAPGAG